MNLPVAPPSYAVSMCNTELRMAGVAAFDRQINAINKNLKDKHGFEKSGKGPWQVHVEGVLGEMAVASVLGCYFNGSITSWKGEDLPHVQVRTAAKDDGPLIIREADRPNFYYVLVTGSNGAYCVRGWIWGREVMESKEHWVDNPGNGRPPAWFVPHTALYDMGELKLRLMDIIP